MVRLEITLSEWFYNSIVAKEVLTISRDYFRLGKPMERRLYEIARKQCGNDKPTWKIGLIPLMEKTGSTGTLRLFRSRLKSIANDDHLPDYSFSVDGTDMVTFRARRKGKQQAQPCLLLEDMPRISPDAIAKGEAIVEAAGTGWDYRAIREQFTLQLQGGFNPDKPDGAFINFVKKKVQECP